MEVAILIAIGILFILFIGLYEKVQNLESDYERLERTRQRNFDRHVAVKKQLEETLGVKPGDQFEDEPGPFGVFDESAGKSISEKIEEHENVLIEHKQVVDLLIDELGYELIHQEEGFRLEKNGDSITKEKLMECEWIGEKAAKSVMKLLRDSE